MSIRTAVQAILEEKHDVVKPLGAIVESSDDAIIGRNLDGVVPSREAKAEWMYG